MGWHPCGMVMDFLRNGYRSQMRTIQGADPVEVMWFEAPAGALAYEGPSVFRSRNWEDDHDNDGMGEQEAPALPRERIIDWYNGNPPAFYTGQEPCGSDRVALEGAVVGRDPLFTTNRVGQGPCCESPLEAADIPISIQCDAEVDHLFAYPEADALAPVLLAALALVTGPAGVGQLLPAVVQATATVGGAAPAVPTAAVVVQAEDFVFGAPAVDADLEAVVQAVALVAGPPAVAGLLGAVVTAAGVDEGTGAEEGLLPVVVDALGGIAGPPGISGTAAVVVRASAGVANAWRDGATGAIVVQATGPEYGPPAEWGFPAIVVQATGTVTGPAGISGTAAIVVQCSFTESFVHNDGGET